MTQDIEEICSRLKETTRYKMTPADAIRKSLKDLVASSLLNIAPQKEKLNGDANLGKREANKENKETKERGFGDGETGFVRIFPLYQAIKDNPTLRFIPLDDLRGMDASVSELKNMVSTFKDKKHQFANLGIERVNRNLLIVGTQGSGKTNTALAFANAMQLPTKIVHGIIW